MVGASCSHLGRSFIILLWISSHSGKSLLFWHSSWHFYDFVYFNTWLIICFGTALQKILPNATSASPVRCFIISSVVTCITGKGVKLCETLTSRSWRGLIGWLGKSNNYWSALERRDFVLCLPLSMGEKYDFPPSIWKQNKTKQILLNSIK